MSASGIPRWAALEGLPHPQGATWIPEERAFNFALYSEQAGGVTLLLYGKDDLLHPVHTYRFDYLRNKSGRFWHCRLPEAAVKDARYYGYSVAGPPDEPAAADLFHPEKILLDPYAKAIFFPPAFDRQAAARPGSNAGRAPLGLLPTRAPGFDWKADRRMRHESDAIIYELHVKGFTQSPSAGVSAGHRGTYAGLVEKIPYLQELGVTAVELLPVFQYDPQEGNYWGYNPLNFFAPHSEYASTCLECGQRDEFRAMVRTLHQSGIEVILDVVYNHTGEGGEAGPVYSFKGIDTRTYYLTAGRSAQRYQDYTGTGNTLQTANRYVRKLILDSLRYWVEEMHVDGFRFDLASVFTRRVDGSVDARDPGLFGDIISDPALAHVRLIAEPWDAAGAYHLGRTLPGITWMQWNDRFRDDVRRFVRGDAGMLPALMTRLYGSDDLFPDDRAHAFRPSQSVNYVTCHDGFTLYDLVAYQAKRNWANGHDNRDGADENLSWNCGWEGEDGVPPGVAALRTRQVKNFCALLFLANGTPMFRAGDEFLQTQHGNNNPYNQNNATSWLDWDRLRTNRAIFRFFKRMIAFRKSHPSLCRSRFWREDIEWHGPEGAVDLAPESRALAYCLRGGSQADTDLYVMINGSSVDLTFRIQDANASRWARALDTALDSPNDICSPGSEVSVTGETYRASAQSVVVLVRR